MMLITLFMMLYEIKRIIMVFLLVCLVYVGYGIHIDIALVGFDWDGEYGIVIC